MFKVQNWKVKLVYAGFGCLFGSLYTIMGMLASPVTAQRDKFDEIECRSLTVVDADGKTRVNLTTDEYGGVVYAFGKDGKLGAELSVDERGGVVSVAGKDGKSVVVLHISELGGGFVVAHWQGGSGAVLGTTEHGGHIRVDGKGGGRVAMSINEYGNGAVSTWDKNGYRQ